MADAVELVLFYVEGARPSGAPPGIERTALILYGEGLVRPETPGPPRVEIEKAADGVRILRVSGEQNAVSAQLSSPWLDHTSSKLRFIYGLVQRPAIVGLPPASSAAAMKDTDFVPATTVAPRVHQFVRVDKVALASAFAEAIPSLERREAVLDRIESLCHCSLRLHHVERFGDVFLVEESTAVDPVEWSAIVDSERRTDGLQLQITTNGAQQGPLFINVRIYGADSIPIQDLHLEWRHGDPTTISLPCSEPIGGAWLRAWRDGVLICEHAYPLLKSVAGVIAIIGDGFNLQDRLTERTQKGVQGGVATTATEALVRSVQKATHQPLNVTAPEHAPWDDARHVARSAVYGVVRAPLIDQTYFPAGREGRALAVLSLAERISRAGTVTIADPFFDQTGAADLLPRISNVGAKLTVVTALDAAGVTALSTWLSTGAENRVLPSALTIWNLQPGAFHDRSLILGDEGAAEVHVLTNSLSGAAVQYPLVVTEASIGAAVAIQHDIRNLLLSAAATGAKLWPPSLATSSRPPMDWRFPGWELLLSKFEGRNGRSDDEWVASAQWVDFIKTDPITTWDWRFTGVTGERLRRFFDVVLCSVVDTGSTIETFEVLGEAVARGLQLTVSALSGWIRRSTFMDEVSFVSALCEHLRRTQHAAAAARDRASLDRLFHAGEKGALVSAGFQAWNQGERVFHVERPTWGRMWLVALLTHLAPRRAIELCDQLKDATLIYSLTSRYSLTRSVDNDSVVCALLESSSCFCRALAVQAIAVPDDQASFGNVPDVPVSPSACARRLAALGVSEEAVLVYMTEWLRCSPQGERLDELARVITRLASDLGAQTFPDLVEAAFRAGAEVFGAVAEQTRWLPALHVDSFSRSVVTTLARAWTRFDTVPMDPTFDGEMWKMVIAFARIVHGLWGSRAERTIVELDQLLGLRELEKFLRPISPLHRRLGVESAARSMGMLLLLEIATVSGCAIRSDESTKQLVDRLRTLLHRFGDDLNSQFVGVATQLLQKPW